jgi:plastocyanin
MSQKPAAQTQAVQITIQDFAYDPNPISVPVGGSVVWVNKDNMTHTATADDGTWNTGNIPGGTSSSPIQFNNAGAAPYHCIPHPRMKGTVQVG